MSVTAMKIKEKFIYLFLSLYFFFHIVQNDNNIRNVRLIEENCNMP